MKPSPRQHLFFALAAAFITIGLAAAALGMRPSPQQPATALSHSPGALAVVGPKIDPLPADEASLLAGRSLYITHCAVCHGAAGGGDDLYDAQSDQPLPDLRTHMAPAIHTDGQILTYIRDGISGTSMPGFGLLLSEVETIQLAAYVRTFGQASPIVGVDPDALATEQARPPTPTPIPDVQETLPKVVFVRDNNLVRSDGGASAPAPITNFDPNTVAQHPAFSPDGQQVAFVALELPSGSTNTITSTLQVLNSDGSGRRTLLQSTEEYLRHPAWSRDGSALYVTTFRVQTMNDGTYLEQMYTVQVDVASGSVQPFLPDVRDLAISTDGAQIAYVRMLPSGVTAGLAVANADGGGERVLVAEGAFEELASPRFSPDGTRVLFAARGEPLVDIPGYQSSQRSEFEDWLLGLVAPSVAQAHGTPSDIWVVDTDGTNLRRLTAIYEDEPIAVFSPDGREIALLGLNGMYRMDSDGGQLRRIDPAGSYGGLDWAAP